MAECTCQQVSRRCLSIHAQLDNVMLTETKLGWVGEAGSHEGSPFVAEGRKLWQELFSFPK